jgi:hypothetical protein
MTYLDDRRAAPIPHVAAAIAAAQRTAATPTTDRPIRLVRRGAGWVPADTARG